MTTQTAATPATATHTTAVQIRNIRLIDGLGGEPADAVDILIEDGTISRINPTGAGPAAPQVVNSDLLTVVDGTGLTAMPGFFDCHVHVTTDPRTSALTSIIEAESAKTLRSVPALRATLHAGVTSARDLAGADSGFRDAIADGLIDGPALQLAIRILSITGGHGDSRAVSGAILDSGPGAGVVGDSPAEFLRLTREVISQGADWVKIAASGGMGSPRSNPEGGGLSEIEMGAVVDEANRHGIAGVAAHSIGTAGIAAAVRAGVRSIEHGYLIDDRTIEEMGERGTYLVPTLSTLTRAASPNTPPWTLTKRARTLSNARERVGAAIRSGVNVALGTDAGIVDHGTNLRELALLVEFGMTPMQAILAGTANAARMSGLFEEVGSIEPGKRADLVATHADPLTDIAALGEPRAMSLVVQAGRIHISPSEPYRA